MGVHITLSLSTPQRKWPMLRQQSPKCASLAAMLLFTSYKSTWLTAISSHCLAALPATDVFNNHMRLKTYYRNLKWTFVAMLQLRNEGHFITTRTQISQPASAGNVADTSELQAQNRMTPQHWTQLLRSVSVISKTTLSLQALSQLSCWRKVFWKFLVLSHNFQVVANSQFIPPTDAHEYRGMPITETAHQLHLLSLLIK